MPRNQQQAWMGDRGRYHRGSLEEVPSLKGGSRLSRVQGCFCAAWHVSESIGTVTQTNSCFPISLSPPLNICVALVTFALLLLSTCVLFLYLFLVMNP